jgi:phosphatidate phosphatase APP1
MVRLIPPQGISVISDIDDTIKISGVTSKKELLTNTFLKEFRAVPGMVDFYRRLARNGTPFHYVSCSPWQLYPPLVEFMDKEGFPIGSLHLKSFRMKDQTFINLFRSPDTLKLRSIESIMKLYPERQFILIGDSGERDPEIYGDIARKYPGQILHIFIRSLEPAGDEDRYQDAFRGIDQGHWTVFREAKELD